MTDDEARHIVLRTWSEHFGGIEEVTHRPTLAEVCRDAANQAVDEVMELMARECRRAAATRSYPAYWEHVRDQLTVIDWDEILNRPRGRPTETNEIAVLVYFCMMELIYGSITTTLDVERRMTKRAAARIVAEVLTSDGIPMTGRKVERLFAEFGG